MLHLPVVMTAPRSASTRLAFDRSADGNSSPDRVAAYAAASELRFLFPAHLWRLVCVDASYEDVLEVEPAVWRVMQVRDVIAVRRRSIAGRPVY